MNKKILNDFNVGISISESADIEDCGFSTMHLQDVLVEFARYFLASGASLIYGGDVSYKKEFNYVKILSEMVRTYNSDYREPAKKITNFVAYPITHIIPKKDLAKLTKLITFEMVAPPAELDVNTEDAQKTLISNNEKDFYIWAKSLTKMRKLMIRQTDARVFLGGKTQNFKGRYPGIIEEAYISMKQEKPVFLIGAYGGAARVIKDALIGKKPKEITEQYQFENEHYKKGVYFFNQKELTQTIDYPKLTEFFNKAGIKGLNNGLTEEENKELFETTEVPEMIMLITKGMKQIKNSL